MTRHVKTYLPYIIIFKLGDTVSWRVYAGSEEIHVGTLRNLINYRVARLLSANTNQSIADIMNSIERDCLIQEPYYFNTLRLNLDLSKEKGRRLSLKRIAESAGIFEENILYLDLERFIRSNRQYRTTIISRCAGKEGRKREG